MDRRSLLDDDEGRAGRREDIFGDEHEVEDFDFVADGFRPTTNGDTDFMAQAEDPEESYSRSSSVQYAPTTTLHTTLSPRDSIRKSRSGPNPFMSAEETEEGSEERHTPLQFEPDAYDVRRSISSASSAIYARTHSPRFGSSTAPSHPYNMYPQATIPRSSVMTSSTARHPDRSSTPRAGPQHPYAMYPQGVNFEDEDEDEDDDLIQQNPVTVGFAGVGNRYRRQMGPDGEEQDIIGEDGHAEQLPPYSRYPDDGPEKVPLLVPTAPTALHSRAPVHGTDPTMPLMHTSLQPDRPAQSMTDESVLERPRSLSNLALITSHSSRASSVSEPKSWNEKSWKEKRRTRFLGVPLWFFMVILAVLVFVFAIVGGVAGGYLAGRKQSEAASASAYNVIVVTSLYDATTIPTPTGTPPPTGTFALTLSTPQEVQRDCITTPNQAVAWACNLAPDGALAINVTVTNGSLGANIFYAPEDPSPKIYYGAQAPSMLTKFAQFLAVKDNDSPDNGPAFYFAHKYNKIVVVPENAFNPASGKFRRDYDPYNTRRDVAIPGDFPWFCVWNNTFLEAFIYIEKPTSSASVLSSSTSPPVSSGTSITSAWSKPSGTASQDSTTVTSSFSTGRPDIYTGPVTGLQSWVAAHQALATAGPSSGGGHFKRQANTQPWSSFPKYPNLIKLEERRVPNSGNDMQPYCQQYQVLWDGNANWKPDINGAPIRIMLNEQDPSYSAYSSAMHNNHAAPTGGCHCQWIAGGQ